MTAVLVGTASTLNKQLTRCSRRALWFALVISMAASAQSDAPAECSCLWQGSFAEVAPATDLVVLGRVTAVKGNAVDLAIERSLAGENWRETVRVWMKARNYCRPDAALFPQGSRWLMALERIDTVPEDGFNPSTPNVSYGRQFDYQLSSCGGYYLKAAGDGVIGNLIPTMPRWEYQPSMTPVLITLVAAYLRGETDIEALASASREDPEMRNLMLDTKSFLRGQAQYLEDTEDGD